MSDDRRIDFVDALNRDFRWPMAGDDPLVAPASGASPGYAELPVWWPGAAAAFISTGFMEAGEHLLAKAAADRGSRAALVLPILLCFRHAIEVSLKRILQEHAGRHGVTCDRLTSTHDLQHLWGCFRRLMNATASEGDEEGIVGAGKIVQAFHRWDSGSFSFRYPTTSKGEPVSFPLESIDLVKLGDTMKGFANFIMGVDGQLDALAEASPW